MTMRQRAGTVSANYASRARVGGRPSSYNAEIAKEICERLANGHPVHSVDVNLRALEDEASARALTAERGAWRTWRRHKLRRR
jgi:hypothetical protein